MPIINHPKVSLILPIYNMEKFLERCVDSILAQTYDNLEIILVNDGSKDRSDEICKKYASLDQRVIYVSQKNGECKIVCVNRYCMNLLYAPYWGKQR